MIPDALIDEVRERADIVEVIGELLPLKRAGKDFRALCPFHHEKTPSFYVVPAKNFFKCFGCGESGDVFTFLMKREGLSFTDAVRRIAERVGVELPRIDVVRREDEPHRALYEAVSFAADFFERMLQEDAGQAARSYLSARGVGEDAVRRFRLGYAPDGWHALREAAHAHGMDDAVLLEAGLIKESERSSGEPYDRFRNRLIFPIAELGGRVVAFGGRVLVSADQPKYLNSPETPIYHKGALLYGLNWARNAIRREGAALVVEGYMDYVSLAARGIENVVAGMGTAMTPEQANLIARYAGRALLLYDSDPAGLRATFRTADALLKSGVHPLVAALPGGDDPDSLVRRGGAVALKPFLDDAVDVLERKLQMLEERHFFDDIDGARRALDRLLPTVRATVDPALRDIYVGRVAQRIGVTRETLEAELRAAPAAARGRAGGDVRPAPVRRADPVAEALRRQDADERLLVLLLVRDPERIAAVRAQLAGIELRDPVYREVYEALAAGSTDALTGPPAERLAALRRDGMEVVDADRSFSDAVANIYRRGLFLQLDAIDLRMARAAESGEADVLLLERKRLHDQLGALPEALGYKRSRRYGRLRPGGRDATNPPEVEG